MDEYFENGYHIDRYHALEEDLLRFLDYVTLEFYPKPQNREYIRSIYLADLMLKIGSNISIFFDKYIEEILSGELRIQGNLHLPDAGPILKGLRKVKRDKRTMEHYKRLEPFLSLSRQSVLLIPLNEKIHPFQYEHREENKSWTESWTEITGKETGYWWNSYNKIKHNAAFEGANLNNGGSFGSDTS